jgi:formylglycine-generating enzyme required for sulfatase activity
MITIPEGEFWMGCDATYDPTCSPREMPTHKVWLPAFEIDRTEVTVGDYSKCVEAGACQWPRCDVHSPIAGPPSFGAWNVAAAMNHVTWFQAAAYCEWANKRLPTEAEWEKAARGTDLRKYPWGDAPPTCCLLVGFLSDEPVPCPLQRRQTHLHVFPVGSRPAGASPFGVLDMLGNVGEWVADVYDPNYYATSPYVNPSGPPEGTGEEETLRVKRDYYGLLYGLRMFFTSDYYSLTRRSGVAPDSCSSFGGFRCARSL